MSRGRRACVLGSPSPAQDEREGPGQRRRQTPCAAARVSLRSRGPAISDDADGATSVEDGASGDEDAVTGDDVDADGAIKDRRGCGRRGRD